MTKDPTQQDEKLYQLSPIGKVVQLRISWHHVYRISLVLSLLALPAQTLLAASDPVTESTPADIPRLDCVIEPSDIVDIGSAVPGVVERLDSDRNDLIEKGAMLAQLESSVERATLELSRERASLTTTLELRRESARFGHLTRQRSESLLKTAAISRHELDSVESETRIAELQVRQELDNRHIASLELLRDEAVLERRTIRSPIDGVVVELFKSVGEYIDDEPLLRIAQLNPLHVEVIVSVDYLGRIVPGMQAEVTPSIPGAQNYLATVERVDRISDAASGTYGVRLRLENPDYSVPAGLRCQVTFVAPEESAEVEVVASEQLEQEVVENTEQMVPSTQPDSDSASQPLPDDAVSAAPVLNAVAPESAGTGCISLGPFDDDSEANEWLKLLQQRSFSSRVRSIEVPGERDFLILAKAQSNTGELMERLQKASIEDRFLIRKGLYKGRVSLGVYSRTTSAQARQRSLAQRGFATEIVSRSQPVSSYWIDVTMSPGNQLPQEFSLLPVSASIDPTICSALLAGH